MSVDREEEEQQEKVRSGRLTKIGYSKGYSSELGLEQGVGEVFDYILLSKAGFKELLVEAIGKGFVSGKDIREMIRGLP